jgi:hypothetical protein
MFNEKYARSTILPITTHSQVTIAHQKEKGNAIY